MGTLSVQFIFVFVILSHGSQTSVAQPMVYDTIVVGMGASGTAAATALAAAGRRVLALEAQDRVGGRVNTVSFGGGIVEVGAEWIHGTVGNSVYELAIRNNVTILPQKLGFKVFQSDGTSEPEGIVGDLVNFAFEASEYPPKKPQPLGKYLTTRIKKYIKEHYPEIRNDKEFMKQFLAYVDLEFDNDQASSSWNDISSEFKYRDLEGFLYMSWHTYGYETLFQILLNMYNGGPGYPNLEIKLDTEVTRISWPQDPCADVVVTCKDGSTYFARNVIVTVSLGVLKERYKTMFSPPLPKKKTEAMKAVTLGVVNKIILSFDEAWWDTGSLYALLWRSEDRAGISEADRWLLELSEPRSSMATSTTLVTWVTGEGAKLVETLPEDVVKRKIMEVFRRFLGVGRTIPEPVEILRSTWYSNPFTRGSYSFDNLLTPQHPTARADLGAPLRDSAGAPRVLFAGEATKPTHYGTVHGAVDTGFREAERLLPLRNIYYTAFQDWVRMGRKREKAISTLLTYKYDTIRYNQSTTTKDKSFHV